ncbi:TetR/AcrR family transcriptional regulator [Flexivirga sp. ID2601S]|uniref:TetR/AcrR family transcriptional regulator n=1 Tax=Flexivirga aerilata TaxID=1656889 RepID=A0A849AD89_9MICO|nr:TetR/AcrR family transcriptional regulator [Flexivirga aerilata]NNG38475.1 TetR/AcrR family transcriptional regulator [Flexivirga aerilata]
MARNSSATKPATSAKTATEPAADSAKPAAITADSAACGGAGAPAKPLRADAARNRQKLIDIATEAFTDDVDTPLDEIARRAGVGIGTLYRHFPTRCDLVLAVYGDQVDALEQRSFDLPKRLGPGEALHEWMRGFVSYYAVKMGLINLLRSMMQGDPQTFEDARRRMRESAARVLTPAIEAGVVRADATPEELTRALGGICLGASGSTEGQETSLAVVDLVYDGLRFGAPASQSPAK